MIIVRLGGLVSAVVLLLQVGCASTYAAGGPVALVPSPSTAPTANWNDELALATRRHEPYLYAVRQADLRATLITPRLRGAFAAERAHFHGRFAADTSRDFLSFGTVDEGVDAPKVIARPEGEEQVLVFVALYVANQKNRDLAVKGTIWDTVLIREGRRIKPLAIEFVRQSPAVAEMFPYVDRFDDLYVLRFPLNDVATGASVLQPGELQLEIASAIARCAVSWTLNIDDR